MRRGYHTCFHTLYDKKYIHSTNKLTPVSSSLIGCPIHMALCNFQTKNLVNYKMFSDESNKLETYTYVRTINVILKTYKSFSGPVHFEILTFFSLWNNQKRKKNTYVYVHVCVCVCVCLEVHTRMIQYLEMLTRFEFCCFIGERTFFGYLIFNPIYTHTHTHTYTCKRRIRTNLIYLHSNEVK